MFLKNVKNTLLDLNALRKFLGFRLFFSNYWRGSRLKIIKNPARGKILVLAPHPDDEVLGCGGTLKKLVMAGSEVKIIYLTNGSRESNDLARKRKNEAKAAAQILGIKDLAFLGFLDGKLSLCSQAVSKIKRIILDFKPDIVFVPYFLDPHPDHSIATKVLASALKNIRNFKGWVWMYEVWSPLFANRLVNIDATIKDKIRALKAHQTQLNSRAYDKAVKGLARYRAGMYNAGSYAEAFFACKRDLFKAIVKNNGRK